MVILVMRAVVNYFEVNEFLAKAHEYNALRGEIGLPAYRVLVAAGGGPVNEVLFVTEFDDQNALEAAEQKLSDTPAVREVLKQMYVHIQPGTVVQRRFEDLE